MEAHFPIVVTIFVVVFLSCEKRQPKIEVVQSIACLPASVYFIIQFNGSLCKGK